LLYIIYNNLFSHSMTGIYHIVHSEKKIIYIINTIKLQSFTTLYKKKK
jgi:hypothetical protein